MAYSTGVSASVTDLMNAVLAFAVAQGGFTLQTGWTTTVSPLYVATTGNWTVSVLSKGGIYYLFQYRNDNKFVCLNTATGVSGSGAIHSQPGALNPPSNAYPTDSMPINCAMTPALGPHVGYHLFTDGKFVNVAVELVPGVFTHMNFGLATGLAGVPDFPCVNALAVNESSIYAGSKNDIFSDGHKVPWLTYNNPNSWAGYAYSLGHPHIRSPLTGNPAPFGSQAPNPPVYRLVSVPSIDADSTGNVSAIRRILNQYGPNTYNGRAPLIPITIAEGSSITQSAGTLGPWYQLGHIPNVAMVNVRNLNPKDIVNTDWMVFPIQQKNGNGVTYLNSQNLGYAYRM